jgi:hypothetical protein
MVVIWLIVLVLVFVSIWGEAHNTRDDHDRWMNR